MTANTNDAGYQSSIQAEQAEFIAALESQMHDFFASQRTVVEQVSPDALPLLNFIESLSTGGKRLRALLCYWGWRGAGGATLASEVVRAGLAIELFQTAALIHDDIIDNSDTRRGAPAVHKRFEAMHTENRWAGSVADFGVAGAILSGDLCLSMSETAFSSVGQAGAWGTYAREVFDVMRAEVMAGQYLDILVEVEDAADPDTTFQRAERVIRYKSAKYSCEHPLVLGGALASGATAGKPSTLLQDFSNFALPLGEGFQMRDDILGVFGKPEVTGKPAGDDLREGKRTVLIALTEKNSTAQQVQLLNSSLGSPNLSLEKVQELQQLISGSGALAEVEQLIDDKRAVVSSELEKMSVADDVRFALGQIAVKALHRLS